MPVSSTIRHLKIGSSFPVRLMIAFNLSPESFYSGSIVRHSNEHKIEQSINKYLSEGAEIIDLGPKSSAPFDLYGRSTDISSQEEIERIKPVLDKLHDFSFNEKVLISVDTQDSKVAEYALKREVDIINDISGLNKDNHIAKIIADYDAAVITMAADSTPGDVYQIPAVIENLEKSTQRAVRAGISESKIIIDPGIGGWVPERTPDNDYQLIAELPKITAKLSYPVLIALSRKSFIGKILELPPHERLFGSLAATAIAVIKGANIIRTHDVKETKDAIKIAENFLNFL